MSVVVLVLGMLGSPEPPSVAPDTGGATVRGLIQPATVAAALPLSDALRPVTPDPLRAAALPRSEAAGPVPAPPQDRWLGEDKFRHFFLSFGAASMAHGAARTAGLEGGESLGAAGAVALGLGVWKELRDRGREGETASVRDLVWDALGVAAALGLAAGT